MIKVKIYIIGKNKETWLQAALQEYTQRLQSTLSIEWILAKNDLQLQQFLSKEPHYICLDPKGKAFTSEAFSAFLIGLFRTHESRLQFVIGGAEGIPLEISAKASQKISLSPMTFTHQITRLILLEQIYRAIEIDRGSEYHK